MRGGKRVADAGEDSGGFNLDLALHAENFQQDFYAFLGWEHLGDQRTDAAEGAFQELHFVPHRDCGGDFDGFLVDDGGAEFGDDVFGDDGGNSSKADDGGDTVRAGDVAVVQAEIEFREDIAGEHGLGDLDLATAARALEPEHGAEDLDADVAHEHAARGGFVAWFGFHTEPAEFLVLEMRHGFIFAMPARVASAGSCPGTEEWRVSAFRKTAGGMAFVPSHFCGAAAPVPGDGASRLRLGR